MSFFDQCTSELRPQVKDFVLSDVVPVCPHFSDDLISYSTHPGKPIVSLLFVRGCVKVVCKAASFTAHVYSMGHLIHSPAAFHTVSVKNAYIDMTNLP